MNKTKKPPTYLSLIVVLYIGISCSNELDNINPNPVQLNHGIKEYYSSSLPMEKFGEFHNIGLKNFIINEPNYEFRGFNKLITDIQIELYKTNPNSLSKISKTYNSNFELVLTGKESFSFLDIMSQEVNNINSIKVRQPLFHILNHQLDFLNATNYLNNYIETTNLTTIENDELMLFLTLAAYSNEYWNRDNSVYLSKNCDPKDQVYFADAIGFIIWGGLGSIGYSWLIDEAQDQQGGGCL